MARSYAFCGNNRFIEEVGPRLAEAGFARVEEPASADVVITYCSSQTALEDLYFGDDGVVEQAAPGSLVIDLSPMTPSFAREVNAVATVSDLVMVEAPLVVADMVADSVYGRGNLSCFVACEGDGDAHAAEILDVLVSSVHEMGAPGNAQLARAAYTIQVAAQVISVLEAEALYRAARRSVTGSGLGDLHAGAIGGQAASVLDAVLSNRFDGAYSVEQLMAELSSAIMAADDVELILPQAEAAMHLLELLAVIGGADKAPSALSLIYGEEADCAAQGLDWTRAEEAYGNGKADDGYDDFDGCGCDHDHDHVHDEFDDYEGYGYDDPYGAGFGYSSN